MHISRFTQLPTPCAPCLTQRASQYNILASLCWTDFRAGDLLLLAYHNGACVGMLHMYALPECWYVNGVASVWPGVGKKLLGEARAIACSNHLPLCLTSTRESRGFYLHVGMVETSPLHFQYPLPK